MYFIQCVLNIHSQHGFSGALFSLPCSCDCSSYLPCVRRLSPTVKFRISKMWASACDVAAYRRWVNWGEKIQLPGGTVLKLQLWMTWRDGTMKRITSCFLVLKTAKLPMQWEQLPKAPGYQMPQTGGGQLPGRGSRDEFLLLQPACARVIFSQKPENKDATHTRQPGKDSRWCGLQFLLWPTVDPRHWYSTSLFHIGEIAFVPDS